MKINSRIQQGGYIWPMSIPRLLYTSCFILLLAALVAACSHRRKKITFQRESIPAEQPFTLPVPEQEIVLHDPPDEQLAAQGKIIYLGKCRICHYTSAATLTGPGWKNITRRRSSSWIMSMILYPDLMIANDAEAKKQRQMFNIAMPVLSLKREEARAVLEFMRSNDVIR